MRLPEKLSPTSEDLAFIEEVEHRQRMEEPPSSTTSTPTRSPSPPAANRERCLLAAPSTCSAGKAQESDGGLSGQAPSEQSPYPQQEGPVRREMALVAAEVRYRDSWQLLSREEAKRRRVGRGEATPLVEYIEVPESLDENKVARGAAPRRRVTPVRLVPAKALGKAPKVSEAESRCRKASARREALELALDCGTAEEPVVWPNVGTRDPDGVEWIYTFCGDPEAEFLYAERSREDSYLCVRHRTEGNSETQSAEYEREDEGDKEGNSTRPKTGRSHQGRCRGHRVWFPDTSDSPVDAARPHEGANRATAREGKAHAANTDSPKKPAKNELFSPAPLDPFEADAKGLTARELDKAIVSRALSQALNSPPRWTSAGGSRSTEAAEIGAINNQSDAQLPWIPAFPKIVHGQTEHNVGDNSRSRNLREDPLTTENSGKRSVVEADATARKSEDSSTEENERDGARSPATLGSDSMEITSDLDVPSDQDEGGW